MHPQRPPLTALLAVAFLLLCATAGAQTITGTVIGDDGEPLIGATVLQAGTSTGTVTDSDGAYEVTVEGLDPRLVVSYIGYLTQTVDVAGRSQLDIQLETDSETLDEVVVIGYGTQTRDDVTGALSSLNAEALEGRPVASFQSALQGQLPGVQITSNSGAPGGASTVRVRGTSSITGGSEPLYVVDGLIIANGAGIAADPFATINPSDIASVTVLKDAAAAAIYGARAANGVILITTKRGKLGAPRINFNTFVGAQSPTNKLDLLNAEQYRQVRNEVAANSGEEQIPNLADGETLANDTDWQDAVFQNGLIQNYELSASGGSEGFNYYTSLGHYNEDGTIIGTGLERTALRINTDTRLGRFKIGNNLSVSRTNIDREYVGQGNSILAWAILSPPTVPVTDPDNIGGFAGATGDDGDTRILNPVAAQSLVDNTGRTTRLLGNVYAEYEVVDGLNLRVNAGADNSTFRNRLFAPFFDLGTGEAVVSFEDGAEVSESLGENLSLLLETTANWRRNFGAHSLDLLAGYTVQQSEVSRTAVRTVGQSISPALPVINGSSELTTPPTGFAEDIRTVSYLGRVMYDYDDRYLATFNFRRDGSSIFTQENYFENFYSGSVGWVVSNESFLADSELSTLKLRGSYGLLGNDQINASATRALLNSNARYVLGPDQDIVPAIAPGGLIANPNLTWEKQEQINVGVDVGLLGDALTLSADYFIKNSEDLLLNFPLPTTTGFDNIFLNAGEVRNSGFEFVANYVKTVGEFTWSVNGNLALLDNEVISLSNDLEAIERNSSNVFDPRNRIEPGNSLFAFYGYETDGIYQSQEEIDAGPTPFGNAAPGDLRYRDLNGDGAIDEQDRTFIGDANQDVTYGFGARFAYEFLDFSMQWQGVAGNQVWNDTKYLTQSYTRVGNLTAEVLDAWTPDNPSTSQPRAVNPATVASNVATSDFFVEDGDYLRLKNVQLGFTLPADGTGVLNALRSARLYVAAQNLLTITNYSGYDPEVGGASGFGFDNIGYPQSRRVTVGLQVGF